MASRQAQRKEGRSQCQICRNTGCI
ncbi:hypothetical protein E2C01_004838 [Portunus trituberculatus]|uniref:Uncharacterized protein n=1 Tax=Portunus trituberculatus TaxID=210409 RepID=A0A5B7CRS0_PORTR|nr:hypothetical protein [Portunus trituberculatus]